MELFFILRCTTLVNLLVSVTSLNSISIFAMKKTILLIDDNLDMRENIAELLLLLGFIVIEAESGKSGLVHLEKQLPDVIICDVIMPDMDGYDFFKAFQERLPDSRIPFIFSTAQSQKADLEKAKNMGIQHYLIKPFDEKELLRCLEKVGLGVA